MKAAHIYDSVFTFDVEWLKEWVDEYKRLSLAEELPYSAFLKADRRNAIAQPDCRTTGAALRSMGTFRQAGRLERSASSKRALSSLTDAACRP